MVGFSGVTAAPPASPPARNLSQNGGVTAFNLVSDQTSNQAAKAGYSNATQQLTSDQQPRGTPAAIASDHEEVKAAQEAVDKAAAKLRSDRAQSALVNVLA